MKLKDLKEIMQVENKKEAFVLASECIRSCNLHIQIIQPHSPALKTQQDQIRNVRKENNKS